MLTSMALAENLGNPATGGANQVIQWCSDGANTFTTGCTDSLSRLLLGPSPNYPDPTPSSPGGNIELSFPPPPSDPTFNTATPTTLTGSFAAGDSFEASSLIESDWTQEFCVQWLTDVLTGNGVALPPLPNDVAALCQQLRAGYDLSPYLLQRVSNSNLSYVTKDGGGPVRVGTATIFNASVALKQIFPELADQVPVFAQFSEPVKVTYQGVTRIKYCAGNGSITATNQWADDEACPFNNDPALAVQFCSHSGNCEILVGGGEGCTPGYWKQRHHFDSWTVYQPDDLISDVFGVAYDNDSKEETLLDALKAGGGSYNAMGRHAVAALLNAAAFPGVNYLYTGDEIIRWVQQAYASGNFEMTKDLFAYQNEQGCPLN